MKIQELQTPAVFIRSKAMYDNLKRYQGECNKFGKELWPMLKTHKSTEIANIQMELGASGFLCGTLDECETLCKNGVGKLMYAYPVAGSVSCNRAVALAEACEFYVRIDSIEGARQLDAAAAAKGVTVNYTIILDCGLHRFGMDAEKILPFAREMKQFSHLAFCGISTHCGHVYGEADADKVPMYAKQEKEAVRRAVEGLKSDGFDVKMVTSGATPTFWGTVDDEYINIYHPGNYIFNDRIQMANRTATEEECALVVYATVISNPREGLLICDAGAKCLGLDQGAHGNSALAGHGSVVGHPELLVTALSEEVGKIAVTGSTDVKVGDRIMIIPNHSCSTANLTDYYLLTDGEDVKSVISVDIRGNSTLKGLIL
jgi:D-serine deaminase-like pyridoxal phosphate-dependent protein